jgi:uncharacterized protein
MTDNGKSCGCSMTHSILMTVVMVAVIGLLYMNAVKPVGNNAPAINPTIQVNQPDSQRNTLTVSGTSQLTVSPDEAILYVSIITDNATAKQAQLNNRETADAVMSALKAQGLNASDIETDSYSLTKLEDYVPDILPKIDVNGMPIDQKYKYVERGYRLTHTLKATTRQIDKVGDLIDVAIGAGGNSVDQINFQLTKETEKKVKADALIKATEAAKEKAKSLAQSAGTSLVKVITVNEQNFYYTPYSSYNVRSNVAMDGGIASAAPTVISPQKVEVTSSVGLVYEIQ